MAKVFRRFFQNPAMLFPVALSILILSFGFDILHSTGWVGATQKNGGSGCTCHGLVPSDSVLVWISGPDIVNLGQPALYTLAMTGGPSVEGGCNVASGSGILSPVDSTLQLISGELTHTHPKSFKDDTVRWQFSYRAPLNGMSDTLFSVGNSVNANGTPTGDQFNFGANFIVHVIDTTVGVDDEITPKSFALLQNYPNPFNPTTKMSFVIGQRSLVMLTVYDVMGREVATVVDDMKEPGAHSVSFDARNLASGIYFYRLQAGKSIIVRKMLLLR